MINFANDSKMENGWENKLLSKGFWISHYLFQIQIKFSLFA